MARDRVSNVRIAEALQALPGWRYEEGKLRRDYVWRDFTEAFAFMTRGALVSERLDHHPEWSNVYNRVEVALTTHDAGGVTESDLQWAREVDKTS